MITSDHIHKSVYLTNPIVMRTIFSSVLISHKDLVCFKKIAISKYYASCLTRRRWDTNVRARPQSRDQIGTCRLINQLYALQSILLCISFQYTLYCCLFTFFFACNAVCRMFYVHFAVFFSKRGLPRPWVCTCAFFCSQCAVSFGQ